MGRVGRTPPRHRGNRDPVVSRTPSRTAQSHTGLVVVLAHRPHRRRGRPNLAVIPASIRPRTHLPAPRTDPRLDPATDHRTRVRGPLDLARHRRPHPTLPRPHPEQRPQTPMGETRSTGQTHTRTRAAGISQPPPHPAPTSQRTETLTTRPGTTTRAQESAPRHHPTLRQTTQRG